MTNNLAPHFVTTLPLDVGGFKPETWRRELLAVGSARFETAGGVISYNARNAVCWLLINPHLHKFALRYSVDYELDFEKCISLVSVGDPARINRFTTLDDLDVVPEGSFIGWDSVVDVIVSFLENPFERPLGVRWVDSPSLNWPEGEV